MDRAGASGVLLEWGLRALPQRSPHPGESKQSVPCLETYLFAASPRGSLF